MVQNDPAKNKLLGSKVEFRAFLLGILVQGLFVVVDIKRPHGVENKAQRGLESIGNTIIRKILYFQVYPDINITDIN